MPTIIGSTTVSVNSAAMAASTALPPPASISAPAADASGWFVTTMPRAPCAGRFAGSNGAPARLRQLIGLLRQPRVPEVQARRRPELAAEIASRDVEREVVAELHAPDVLVHERLDPLDERLALLHVALLAELREQ